MQSTSLHFQMLRFQLAIHSVLGGCLAEESREQLPLLGQTKVLVL